MVEKNKFDYFQDCLRDCARDPKIVEEFNKAHGSALVAPLRELLPLDEGGQPPQEDSQVVAFAVSFIRYVYETVWREVERSKWRLRARNVMFDADTAGAWRK